MRFVHIADMHFDMEFSELTNKKDLGDIRRLEQRRVFKKAIEYIKTEKIPFLFISGDLLENKNIRKSTIEYINGLFETIPDTKIFISPGNHDPFLKNSFYATYQWGTNVHIFDSKIERIELEEVDIYGYGFSEFYCENCQIEELEIKNKDKKNILIIHADLNASKNSEKLYNPINEKTLIEKGFNYVALGHIHKGNYNENKEIVYSGSMISLGFDELGEHGLLDVKIETENTIKFVKLDDRIFKEKAIDISNMNSIEEVIENINNFKIEENVMYKIILVGIKNFEVNTNKIFKLLLQPNILKIKDDSKIGIDLEKMAEQNNLKGIFIKELLEKLKENNEDKEIIEKAIEIGLEALIKK